MNANLTYKVLGQKAVIKRVTSIDEAVALFVAHRQGLDAKGKFNGTDFGSSELRSKVLVVEAGKVLAEISYNGNVRYAHTVGGKTTFGTIPENN